jgi:hypothetical protein
VIVKILNDNNIDVDKLLIPVYENRFEKFLKKVENFLESNKSDTRFASGYYSAKVNIIHFLIIFSKKFFLFT